nr:hypothetical protein [Nocardioides iriomotensis]
MEQDRVAGLRLATVQCRPDVVDGDDVAPVQPGDTAHGRRVHEPAAGHQLRHRLGPELARAPVLGELADVQAVVAAVADLEVVQHVEVGPELGRGRDRLDDPVDPVVPQTAGGTVNVVGGGDQRLPEVPAREHRHALVEHPAEVVHPAGPHEGERVAPLRVGDVVEHADLVLGTER